MVDKCVPIGSYEAFGGTEAMHVLSNESSGGIADVIDTCDLRQRYGDFLIPDETVPSLFTDKDNKLLPVATLNQRIQFIAAYPAPADISKKVAKLDPLDPQIGTKVLDLLFGALATAHHSYDVPYLPHEETFLETLAAQALAAGDARLAQQMVMWGCSSDKYPEQFFKNLARASFKVTIQLGLYDFDAGSSARKSPLGQCENVMHPSKKTAYAQVKDAFTSITIASLKKEAGSRAVTVFYLWSPSCKICTRSMPTMKDIHNALKGIDGAVVDVLHVDEEVGAVKAAEKDAGIEWKEIKLADDDASALNPYGGVPVVIIADKTGKIREVIVGGGPDLKGKVEKALKRVMPVYPSDSPSSSPLHANCAYSKIMVR